MTYITLLNYSTMAKEIPKEYRARGGNRKAAQTSKDEYTVYHTRINAKPLGKIVIDETFGDRWFYGSKLKYTSEQLRDIVYLMDRVGRLPK